MDTLLDLVREKSVDSPNPRWILICQVKRGHTFYYDKNRNEVAISEGSGYYPHQTEGGILYVDRRTPIVLGDRYHSYTLKDIHGGTSTILGTMDEVQFLMGTLGMEARFGADGKRFRIQFMEM